MVNSRLFETKNLSIFATIGQTLGTSRAVSDLVQIQLQISLLEAIFHWLSTQNKEIKRENSHYKAFRSDLKRVSIH